MPSGSSNDNSVVSNSVCFQQSKPFFSYSSTFRIDPMEAFSTLKALQMALKKRKYTDKPLIHHSDRGLQYCSKAYTQILIDNNITISMTENGDPYENAVAERVNGILKDEFGLKECFDDLMQCHSQTEQSIDIYTIIKDRT